MSATVDERVVQMRFDNRQFENNVQTSISSLNELNQSLKLEGASKGLKNVAMAAKDCDLSGLSAAAETVRLKFSALEAVGVTALMNITNRAVDAGVKLVESLSIDQIAAGWDKYGQKTASVQTIMNATGKSIDEVNGYLDKLMWFSDETSYGFTDMTAALGQLTSAGGDIEKLIPMITGIANATAYAGKGSSEFSRAIYNLNQSYSAGSLQYMDWKSLELAGIASKELKQTFIDTAVAMGKIKEGEVTIANFGQTLKDKWADTSVMEAAFGKFGEMIEKAYEMVQAGEVETASEAYAILAEQYDGVSITAAKAAQEAKTFMEAIDATKDAVSSGWMKTFELIFGNYEEAKALWTDLANELWEAFASGGETRNDLLKGALSFGGSGFLKENIAEAEVFKDTILDVAREMRHARIDEFIGANGGFEESLSKGWLSADILAESISRVAEETANLSDKDLEYLGYTREQIEKIQELNAGIQDGSVDLEEYAHRIANLSGRENLIEAFWNTWNGVADVLTNVKEAFEEVFPPMTVEQLYAFTEKVKELTEKFKMSDETSQNLHNTFRGLFAVLDLVKQGLIGIYTAFSPVVKGAGNILGSILSLTGGIGEFLVGLDESVKSGEGFTKVFERIGSVLGLVSQIVYTGVQGIVEMLKSLFTLDTSGLDSLSDKLETRFKPFSSIGEIVTAALSGLLDVMKKIIPIFASLASGFVDVINGMISAITTGGFEGAADLLNTGFFGVLVIGIKKFMDSLSGVADNAGGLLDKIVNSFKDLSGAVDVLKGVEGCLDSWQKSLKADTLFKIAAAIGILAVALIALATIDSDKLTGSLTAISVLFADLFGSMSIFEKTMGGAGFKGITKIVAAMIPLSVAVLILAAAVKKLADCSWEELEQGLTGVGALCAMLVVSAKLLSTSQGKLIKGALGLIAFAGAVRILAGAVKYLGELDINTMQQGLIGVGAIFAEIVAFTRLTGNSKGLISTAVAMTIMGAAMNLFAVAVGKFGTLPLDTIKTGLAAMAGVLTELTIAMRLMPKNMLSTGAGLVVVAGAMLLLSKALESMGGMKLEDIGKGLLAMGGSLLILAGAMRLMTGALSGAAAMLVVAAALNLLAPALKKLGGMSLEQIGLSLVALAGAFAVLGLAAVVLAPLAPVVLSLSAAIGLLGVGVLAVGVGVLAFATGLTALAAAGAGATTALVLMATSLLSLIPMVFKQIGNGVVALAGVIKEGAPAIMEAAVALLTSFLQGLLEVVPLAVEVILSLLEQLLAAIAAHMPAIVQSGMDILMSLLEGIRDNIGDIVGVVADIITEFLGALGEKLPEVIDAGIGFITDFINGLAGAVESGIPDIMGAIGHLVSSIVKGLKNGLFSFAGGLFDAGGEMGDAVAEGAAESLDINSPSKRMAEIGEYAGEGLCDGVENKIDDAKEAASDLSEEALDAIKNRLGIRSNSSTVMSDEVGEPIVDGIAEGIEKNTSATKAAKMSAENIVKTFKTELDKMDLDKTTANLEYQLWEALNPNANDSQKMAQKATMLTTQLAAQTEKVNLAQAEYQTTLENLGATAEETQQAYNKLLQEQITMASLQKELNEAQKTNGTSAAQTMAAYARYMAESQEDLLKIGYTMEQIEAAARKATGYDPNSIASGNNSLIAQSVQIGSSMATAISSGVQNESGQVANAAVSMVETCALKIKDQRPQWVEGANYLVDGFVQGIRDNTGRAADEASNMATAALTAAMGAIGVASPSKAFAEIGMYADLGFAKGLQDYTKRATDASATMANETLNSLTNVVGRIRDFIENDVGTEPTIRPVLDLSNVETGAARLNTIFSREQAMSVSSSISSGSSHSSAPVGGSSVNNYQFIQNNQSPKALSRAEIYRQTSNQFSAFKQRMDDV